MADEEPTVVIKYVERIMEVPKYVEKIYEIPVVKTVDVIVERVVYKDVPVDRPVYVEKSIEVPVHVEKRIDVPVIVRDESLLAVRHEDWVRLKAAAEALPGVLAKLDQIVRWEPQVKQLEVETQVVKFREVEVEKPVYKEVTIERPRYLDVGFNRPIVREEIIVVKKLMERNDAGELVFVGWAKE